MENFKNILPDDVFHVITKGITCELCVADKNLANFTKFSDFITDNLTANVHYCYVCYCELPDGGLYILDGGFKYPNLDLDVIENIYNCLIDSFNKSYNGNETINHINVSFHPYDTIIRLKEFKGKVGL